VVVAEGIEKELRELLKEREVRKQDINALVNQLHALAIRTGIRLEQKSGLSQDPEKWKSAIDRLEAGSQAQANRLYLLALSLFQVLEEIEEAIKEKVNQKEEYGPIRLRLQKQPGIGFWSAVALLAWSGKEAERFPTPRQAASYFGLVTATRQSGDQNRLGKITKEGPPLVRRLMIQSAWAFIRSKEGRASRWGQWFLKEVKRRPNQKKILIVALARKLVTAAIACLKNHTQWDNRVLDQEKQLEKVESQNRKKKRVPVKPPCGRENYGNM
jgi:transposase